jgi:Na+-driven multidrug efflux pump
MGREGEEQIKAPLIISSITHEEDGYGKVTEEIKKQLWLAGPLICVSLLQYSLQLISIMFVGHLGELSLSGASMATSFATVTGFSLFVSTFYY